MRQASARLAAAIELISFAALPGWAKADLTGAWPAFRASAARLAAGGPPLRPAMPPSEALLAVCRLALRAPEPLDPMGVRTFFEHHFEPARVALPENEPGFLTGYYEPVVSGSRHAAPGFAAPILPRPDDLVTLPPGTVHPDVPPDHAAGRYGSTGLEIYPDRTALETFAMTPAARPVVWLRDWTEVFLVQVQGSARVRFDDGTEIRLVYAGRNGHPYTSIGRILIETGQIAEGAMTLEALKTWLRCHGQAEGQEGRTLMQRNRSYIFFRAEPLGAQAGPTGGAGVPLVAGRSIAIDRTLWSYGLPFWIASEAPVPGFGPGPLARLFVAQDTGSAIVGPARADLFVGSGDEAGVAAGGVRHAARFSVLLPRAP